MNKELLTYCENEIQDLPDKKVLSPLGVIQPFMLKNKQN